MFCSNSAIRDSSLNEGSGEISSSVIDVNFNKNSLLITAPGVNGSQNNSFIDSSINSLPVTRVGNPVQGSFSPFSPNGWSCGLTNTSKVITSVTSALNVGTGDFTVEGWYNFKSFTHQGQELFNFSGITTYNPYLMLWSDGRLFFRTAQTSNEIVTPFASGMVTNTWYHWAVSKIGNTFYIYKNGILVSSGTSTGIVSQNKSVSVGLIDGYVSNFRVITGTALYTSNFIPATTPLVSVAGTSCLMFQSNRFVDNSINNLTTSFTGTPKILPISPFNAGIEYSKDTAGGSIFFDGVGDYLSINGFNTLNYGKNDFTIEMWIYPKTTGLLRSIYDARPANTNGSYIQIGINPSNYIIFYTLAGNFIISNIQAPVNAWTHIAMVASGGSSRITKCYINGKLAGSFLDNYVTGTGNIDYINPNTNRPIIGVASYALDYPFIGHIANMRCVKGTALYTTDFTPASSPSTAITNTALLLNCTNAGIIDVTCNNVIETIGNVQVSTLVKKYGLSSMYFDGSGDYLKLPVSSESIILGSGDFTIEAWVYPTSSSHGAIVCGQSNLADANGSAFVCYCSSVSNSDLYIGPNVYSVTSPNPTLNTWSHVAWVRNGGTWKTFLNGLQVGSLAIPSTAVVNVGATNYPATIGAMGNNTNAFTGYIDDLRITKGLARYTANFVPSMEALSTR